MLVNKNFLLFVVVAACSLPHPDAAAEAEFSALKNVEVSDAKSVLSAHENLVKADTDNAAKFQDVIAFLKNQVEAKDKE